MARSPRRSRPKPPRRNEIEFASISDWTNATTLRSLPIQGMGRQTATGLVFLPRRVKKERF